jgi:hypothetical protein
MALSNIYTAKLFWNAATREIKAYKQNDLVYNERFNLINQACLMTQGLVSDIVAEAYKKDTTAVLSTTGKYGTTGTFTSATNALVATMSSSFSSADVGNMIILRTGTTVYIATIQSYVSATSVILYGDNLPSVDVASFDTITMAGTTPTGTTVSISSLRLLRFNSQLRLQLISTATENVNVELSESFPRWRTSASQNLNSIIWCLVGTNMFLNKGDSVSSYGTLTIRYPGLPDLVTLDTDYVDLIDGIMVVTGIMVLKTLIEKRLGVQVSNNGTTIVENVQAMYRSAGNEVSKEIIKAKVESLL